VSNLNLEEVIFGVLSEYQEETGVNAGPLNDLRVNLVREIGVWLEKKKIEKQLHKMEEGLDERRYQRGSDNDELFGSTRGIEASLYGYPTIRSPEND